MACNCHTTAFRLFMRSVTQLQFAESLPTAAARQRLRPAARGVTLGTLRSVYSTAPCRQAAAAADAVATRTASSSDHEASTPEQRSPRSRASIGERADLTTARSAVVADLTPEAIDSLASEIGAGTSLKKAPAADDGPDAPGTDEQRTGSGKKARWTRAEREAKKKAKQDAAEAEAEKERSRAAKKCEPWQVQKEALKAKFGEEGWKPRRKLSPDALAGIRALHDEFPEVYTTAALAARFEISPEAVRRILKSRWEPSPEEEEERQLRWFKRGKKIWERNAELGMKPPRRWRDEGIKKKRRPRAKFLDPDIGRLVSPYRARRVVGRRQEDAEDESELD